jgi:hypothetical protein
MRWKQTRHSTRTLDQLVLLNGAKILLGGAEKTSCFGRLSRLHSGKGGTSVVPSERLPFLLRPEGKGQRERARKSVLSGPHFQTANC